jgi:hypothetical protein
MNAMLQAQFFRFDLKLSMNTGKNSKNTRETDHKKQERHGMPDNFWTSIADDAAHGYGASQQRSNNPRTKLNEDQLPGDNERG